MKSYQNVARIVGVLYIIGTVAGIMSVGFAGSLLEAPDYLAKISANESQFVIGALCVLVMGLALAMVPVMMFPILKKQNEHLALGYVIFRGALEAITDVAIVVVWLSLMTASREYLKAGTSDPSYFQTIGTLLQGTGDGIGMVATIIFSLGALMFYYLLYQTKLVPRWLSGWGLITAIPYLTAGVLQMFTVIEVNSTAESILMIPLGIQEMVMAVWLVVRGFNSSAIIFNSEFSS
jgi:hypothetical protein